ncbi:FemAB-related protein, PEP-CTERM system-associated [Pseudomonas reidholzensis]|uniref:FemAB-related protein, PEP-CTERM system-associated n=1 Tax=Pseudomonas reidholzensis TaxID=1785162 RepID=A0A383RRZ9_9PSED|nr:GNAT family N-acetyltransferase [Pseudomonas reidholzensis]SYX89424.1 FemAB-related protein, PEP-CTERM system-associated [Pseudomonas reidholzensis]
MKCVAYSAEHRDVWDQWVGASRTPLFFFKRDFMEYHADRFEDASLLFYDEDDLLAVLPASRHGDVLSSHGGLTFGGLIFGPKVRADSVLAVFDRLVAHAREMGYRRILYKSIPYIFASQGAQEDLYALTRIGANLVRRDLSSVIYQGNRPKMSKGRKWLVARAAKLGLKAEVSQDWDQFHDLLATALQRHGAQPVHSAEELKLLQSRFPDNIQLNVILHEQRMVAGAVLFRFGHVTHTQYLATNDEGKDMGALDALIEHCIREGEERRETFFSFGISTEDGGKVLNSGLINQKENFGARGIVLDFYEININ